MGEEEEVREKAGEEEQVNFIVNGFRLKVIYLSPLSSVPKEYYFFQCLHIIENVFSTSFFLSPTNFLISWHKEKG